MSGHSVVPLNDLILESQNGLSKRSGADGVETPVLRLGDIKAGAIDESDPREIRLTAKELAKYALQQGDLVCIRVNGSKALVGRVIQFRANRVWAYCDHFIRFRPNQALIDHRYLAHYFNSQTVRRHIELNMVSSAGQNTVSQGTMLDIPVPCPGLETQREIVAELEKQFSRLDEAVANLQRVKANLKRYKASVLSEFFDSKVSGWRKCQLKTVCQVISGFAFKSTDFSRDGVPVVKIANIGYGEFHWKDQEYLPSSFLESQRAFAIQPCDLLMALTRPITNGTLKVCLYPHDAPVALLNQRVAVLRVGVDLGREFLLLMMQSAAFKNQLQDALSETLQPNLSPVDLKNFEISIPSGPEQARIVAEVDRHLSIIREVEAEVDANLQRAQALRQAVLSRAFLEGVK